MLIDTPSAQPVGFVALDLFIAKSAANAYGASAGSYQIFYPKKI
ncbi:MAG: hypothetical protein PHU77_01280 [Simplicispira sp.]|nr:hypothetical protein [Simplicispira sp.]